MARTSLEFPMGIDEVLAATSTRGTILCASSSAGANGMTIGWISIGHIWGEPICTVMVRPSRHTFKIIEAADSFTVNVLPESLQSAVDLFGEKSGRDLDKFKAAKLTTAKGLSVSSPFIEQSTLALECTIAYKQPLEPHRIKADFITDMYGQADYHTFYYGKVVSIHKAKM